MDLGIYRCKLYRWGDTIMAARSLMVLEMGFDHEIRCRHISEWCKVEFYVPSKEKLMSEIEKNKPDVVVLDLDLYNRIGGIDTLNMIRDRLCVNAWFE
jgi:hypothetical protein